MQIPLWGRELFTPVAHTNLVRPGKLTINLLLGLLEHAGLYEQLSAEDNLEFFGRVNRMSATDRLVRIQELLGNIGLWERRKEKVGKWRCCIDCRCLRWDPCLACKGLV